MPLVFGTNMGDVESAVERVARPSSNWTVGGGAPTNTFTGRGVSPESALGIGAAYACVTLIADTIAGLSLEVFDRDAVGNKIPVHDDVWQMLAVRPNRDMSANAVWGAVAVHLLTRGNFFALKFRSDRKNVDEIYPVLPQRVYVYRDANGDKRYRIMPWGDTSSTAEAIDVGSREMLHVPGLSFGDGLVGHSPIAVNRQRFGVALAQTEHQGRFFRQAATPRGVLTVPGILDDEVYERVRDDWRRQQEGLDNAYATVVLEQGATYQPIGMSNADAQFIQQMEYTDTDVARIFRVPAAMIGAPGATMTYANASQNDLHYAKYAVAPWLQKIEAALVCDADLFPVRRRPRMARFNMDDLLRADVETRHRVYEIQYALGMASPNELRRKEDISPRTDAEADSYSSAGSGSSSVPSVRSEVRADGAPIVVQPRFHVQPQQVRVDMPNQPAPVVNVTVPEQPAPVVNVDVPAQPAPVVNVAPAAAEVRVDVPAQPAPIVNVETPARSVKFERNRQGFITGASSE